MSRHVKPGRVPKGGIRHSVRFMHEDVYQHALETWKELGFDSFSTYVDFTFSLAHGKWRELGFRSPEEGAEYLMALSRGSKVKPPQPLNAKKKKKAAPLRDAAA
ncbi:hypothetical protein [Planobispora takensis]|uniref:hypothetical protein n=1 Tax=Planobispora takensis TaxID=1367882 RepID=UPI001942816F|nr:hypothetical protein [Planobispora takensis]